MVVCPKFQIENRNLVIDYPHCYARNNVRHFHMIEDFEKPEFFPDELRLLDLARSSSRLPG